MLTSQILEVRGQSGTFAIPVDSAGNVPHDWPNTIHQARAVALAHRQPIPPGTLAWCDGLDADGVVIRDHGEDGIEVYVENDVDGKPIRERYWMAVEDLHGAICPPDVSGLPAALTPERRAELSLPAA